MSDARVSWHHAVLRHEQDTWIFEDAGSTNGTFVGTERVDRITISSDCVIRLGNAADGPILRCEPAARPVHAQTEISAPVGPGPGPGPGTKTARVPSRPRPARICRARTCPGPMCPDPLPPAPSATVMAGPVSPDLADEGTVSPAPRPAGAGKPGKPTTG